MKRHHVLSRGILLVLFASLSLMLLHPLPVAADSPGTAASAVDGADVLVYHAEPTAITLTTPSLAAPDPPPAQVVWIGAVLFILTGAAVAYGILQRQRRELDKYRILA